MALPNEVSSLLIGAAANQGGYEIEQSLRFDGSSYLTRTNASAPTNQYKATFSVWVKLDGRKVDTDNYILQNAVAGGPPYSNGALYYETNSSNFNFVISNNSNPSTRSGQNSIRDHSAWYHVVFVFDHTQSTSADGMKIYVNGLQRNGPDYGGETAGGWSDAQNQPLSFLINGRALGMGRSQSDGNAHFAGYMAEFHCVDGQVLSPTDFGEYDDNGVWRPIKYSGTYGNNGWYLKYDPTATNGLGHDYSGNGNNWTPTNFTTSGTGTDVMSDTPTKNWATFNPLVPGASSFSNGNLTVTANGSGSQNRGTPFPTIKLPDSGKWYAEFTPSSLGEIQIGLVQGKSTTGAVGDTVAGYYRLGTISVEGSGTVETVASFTNGDVIGVIVNADDQEIRFSKNGTIVTTQAWDYSSAPNSSNCYLSFKQGSSSGSCTAAANYGAQGFAHTPPTGYKALNTSNLSAPSIKDGSEYFDTLTWTGDSSGASRTLSGLAFGSNLVWAKGRNQAISHQLTDIVRGAGATSLRTDDTRAEGADGTSSGYLSAFTSDGFETTSSSTNVYYNTNTYTYVAWNWLAGGSGSSNTDGSITSTVSANPSAGFSIVTYTGTGSAVTVGHGLGVALAMVIVKDRSTNPGYSWYVYHQSLVSSSYFLRLNTTGGQTFSNDPFNGTAPTSTVFSVGGENVVNTHNYVAYCFAEVEGYSKFGKYSSNNSQNGPFVYCGFKPSLIVVKSLDGHGGWMMYDTTRMPFNPGGDSSTAYPLSADRSNAESSFWNAYQFDILSNGFKLRSNQGDVNYSGDYIYMAFSEHPFGGSGVSPATAR
jgi:hypothetical protein